MIKRLWEPILWRHLKVANHMARMSSAEMLFNAFPIENPDDEVEVRNRELEGQYQVREYLK